MCRILLGGYNDVVRTEKNSVVTVLHTVSLATRHRVSGDKFGVGAEHFLHRLNYAALYTGDIGHNDAGAECLLVFTHPVEQNVRIQRENDEVGSAYRLGIGLGVADVDVVMSEREIYRIVAAVDSLNMIALAVQRHCVAAADETETYYKNFCVIW